MTVFPPVVEALASRIVSEFTQRNLTVATAESCTGGLIAGALTEISGSSAVVDRGFVTYSNRAKVEMLGVDEKVLGSFGAVSRETALQMVAGALRRSGADLAVAVTGVAGPTGGSAEKPVGLVHIAARHRDGRLIHREMRYGDLGRDGIRMATVTTALEMLLDLAAKD
ncbi:MAG: CinA family protein [Rhizobiaceae bacterium]|nr:CinA family protein [Rhizobiaceae bacterium]